MNLCEIGLFAIVWDVSRVPLDNYHEILWKLCFVSKIYWYIWISGGYGGDVHIPLYNFCLLLKKTEKVQEHDLNKSNSTSFWFNKFFPKMNNKKITKRGPQWALLQFFYKVSIVVVIDFIAILLTPGIFLIQIVNTNLYLINFHSKNIIKMHFPKSWVFKVQNLFRHSLYIRTRWNKLRWHQQRCHNSGLRSDFQKNNLINIYNT